jgi:tryptophan 2-monooxygenase
MSFVPNKLVNRTKTDAGYPGWPPLDTLYDYTAILNPNQAIGIFPNGPTGTVGIIGGGPAGMVAAYELLRMGVQPTVFEASDRLGGRNYSLLLPNGNGAIGEMGAMRVPPSARVFQYYANQFGLVQGVFPDPGKVPTTIYYRNQALQWNFGAGPYPTKDAPIPPGEFAQIQTDWNNFIGQFVTALDQAWAAGTVQQLWQQYISQYAQVSFYEALVQGIPTWGPAQLAAFGALGIGSGGFGPLYEINFLELLRIVLNQWEDGQQLILGLPNQSSPVYGISALTEALYNAPVNGNSLANLQAVTFNTTVTAIEFNSQSNQTLVFYTQADGNQGLQAFNTLIVTTTTRSMEVMGLSLPTVGLSGQLLLDEDVAAGIRDLHLMSSSKLFVTTPTKFWNTDPNVSWNIQTDEMVRGVYTLDYPWTSNGVVLISYTWGDDSDKLLAMNPQQRFQVFQNIIDNIDSDFAGYLNSVQPNDIVSIDWEAEMNYFGAFKLDYPGQEPEMWAVYYQFINSTTPVFLAGDSVSWSGGWTEGALETGLNAACAAARLLGATFPNGSPLDQNPNLYNYGQTLPKDRRAARPRKAA